MGSSLEFSFSSERSSAGNGECLPTVGREGTALSKKGQRPLKRYEIQVLRRKMNISATPLTAPVPTAPHAAPSIPNADPSVTVSTR